MHKKDRIGVGSAALKKAAIIVAIALVLVAGFFLLRSLDTHHGDYTKESETLNTTVSYNGEDYVLKENIDTVLILGLDKASGDSIDSYNNNKQADFLMLLVIDDAAKTCNAIYINRDTIAEMDILGVAGDKVGTVTKQIALAHTYGNGREVSCRNTANAVSNLLLGMEIDHYVSVSMDAVPVYNDYIGGVTLEMLDDFSSIDSDMIKGETVTLAGEQALSYVRSRYGLEDPTNIGRMKRQKQYLEAAYNKSQQLIAEDSAFIAEAALLMTDYLVSDCSGNRLETLFERISEYEINTVHEIEGESVKGEQFMEFYPDEASVLKIIIECFYEMKN